MSLFIIKLSLTQLVSSGAHLGHNYWVTNNNIKPFLIGYKNSLSFINIYYTNLQLKLLINCIYNLVKTRQNIYILKDFGFTNLSPIFSNLRRVSYFEDKWVGGLITNFKLVRHSLKKQNIDLCFLPSIGIFLNISKENIALNEFLNLEIPVSCVLDTNYPHLFLINYPIIGNNKSQNSIFLYAYLIKNSILKGIKEEFFNILKIT